MLHAVLSYGTNWSTIAASHTPQRTTLALKNRYSKLRLRHQNSSSGRESSSAKAPPLPPTEVENRIKPKNNIQEEGINGNGDAEDEEGDEDDEDEEEEGDVDKDDDGRSTRSPSAIKSSLGPHELSARKAGPHDKPNMGKMVDIWAGYTRALPSKSQASYGTPKTTAEQWMDGAMDQPIYVSADTQLFPGEGFLNATQNCSGVDASMSFAGHCRFHVIQLWARLTFR